MLHTKIEKYLNEAALDISDTKNIDKLLKIFSKPLLAKNAIDSLWSLKDSSSILWKIIGTYSFSSVLAAIALKNPNEDIRPLVAFFIFEKLEEFKNKLNNIEKFKNDASKSEFLNLVKEELK